MNDDVEPTPPGPRPHDDRTAAYRVGRKNQRNIYRTNMDSHEHDDDCHIGVMFTPEDGATAVAALNLLHDLETATRSNGDGDSR